MRHHQALAVLVAAVALASCGSSGATRPGTATVTTAQTAPTSTATAATSMARRCQLVTRRDVARAFGRRTVHRAGPQCVYVVGATTVGVTLLPADPEMRTEILQDAAQHTHGAAIVRGTGYAAVVDDTIAPRSGSGAQARLRLAGRGTLVMIIVTNTTSKRPTPVRGIATRLGRAAAKRL